MSHGTGSPLLGGSAACPCRCCTLAQCSPCLEEPHGPQVTLTQRRRRTNGCCPGGVPRRRFRGRGSGTGPVRGTRGGWGTVLLLLCVVPRAAPSPGLCPSPTVSGTAPATRTNPTRSLPTPPRAVKVQCSTHEPGTRQRKLRGRQSCTARGCSAPDHAYSPGCACTTCTLEHVPHGNGRGQLQKLCSNSLSGWQTCLKPLTLIYFWPPTVSTYVLKSPVGEKELGPSSQLILRSFGYPRVSLAHLGRSLLLYQDFRFLHIK